MIVYVDDMLMLAAPRDVSGFWSEFENIVNFKDPEAPLPLGGEQPGFFIASAASHVATLLFLGRVARPDIAVAVQRVCRVVTKLTTTHDTQLLQLYAYFESANKILLFSELSPADFHDVQLVQ